jgi:hypothetical protein
MSDPFAANTQDIDVFRPPIAPENLPAAQKARGRVWLAIGGVVVILALAAYFGSRFYETWSNDQKEASSFESRKAELAKEEAKYERWKALDAALQQGAPQLPELSDEERRKLTPAEQEAREEAERNHLVAVRQYEVSTNVDGWLAQKNVELQAALATIRRPDALMGPDVDKKVWQKNEAAALYRNFESYRASLRPPAPPSATPGDARKTGEVK